MPPTSIHYVAARSAQTYPLDLPLWWAPDGSGHVNLSPGPGIGRDDIDRHARGPWRYRAALALEPGPMVSLGEGGTPLVPKRWDGADVQFKLEFMAPTGSFKDRGTAVMVSYLKQRGVGALIEDSSGNAGAAVAAYAAAAGMGCRVFVPAAASPAKLVQMRATGAGVIPIAGTRSAVTEAAIAAAAAPGAFYASHNRQPFFLEGTKTLAYELWEDLDFRAPDAVVTPVGGGGNLLGCYIGFTELLHRGEIARMPRLYAVQPAACAPLVAAHQVRSKTVAAVTAGETVAEGIVIADPVRGAEMLAALRDSGGGAVAVEDSETITALDRLSRMGLFVEPTSAAAGAGLSRLLAEGAIRPGETVAVILTGSGLKAAPLIGNLLGC